VWTRDASDGVQEELNLTVAEGQLGNFQELRVFKEVTLQHARLDHLLKELPTTLFKEASCGFFGLGWFEDASVGLFAHLCRGQHLCGKLAWARHST